VEVAGYVARLSQGLEVLGWDVVALDLTGNPYGYEGAARAPDGILGVLASMARRRAGSGRAGRVSLGLAMIPMRLLAGCLEVPRQDAVVYVYGQPLAWGIDVLLARRRGIPVVTVYLGSDSRPAYLDGHYIGRDEVPWLLVAYRAWRASRQAPWMAHRSTAVICHAPSAQFLKESFVDWLAVGIPVGREPGARERARVPDGVLRVMHAPSDRVIKGSDAIRSAVVGLQREGRAVELREVAGVSNKEVLASMADSDLVIDQLYSDTPLSGIACESAAVGTPVVTFGYAGPALAESAQRLGLPMGHYLPPDQLQAAIARAVDDPAWLRTLGEAASSFVDSQWSIASVSERFERVVLGDVPEEWMVDPRQVDYALGCGVAESRLRMTLVGYVRRFGIRCLWLPDGSPLLAAVTGILRPVESSEGRS
jgi:glycosyltransferase involved in cell wall biosynthesis